VRRARAARGRSPLFAQYDANFSNRAAATIRRSEPITVAGASALSVIAVSPLQRPEGYSCSFGGATDAQWGSWLAVCGADVDLDRQGSAQRLQKRPLSMKLAEESR
jgi:hypothetical protein